MQLIENFISNPKLLENQLMDQIHWDERMRNRKTASFGKAYNYSEMSYPEQDMLPVLVPILRGLSKELGFESNNCLLNYYPDGRAKMGWHSDDVELMQEGTGVAILSLGAERTLHFRKIEDKSIQKVFALKAASLFYMDQAVQATWQHAIPKAKVDSGRLSLTFRALI